jgi:small subunit ribosomal protein S9
VYVREGKGEIKVNGRELAEYFPISNLAEMVQAPLAVTDNTGRYGIAITVRGGGISGQAEACRHGLARALLEIDPANRVALRTNGFLTRDARMVERKKYGQPGARRKFQFSKR